MIQSRKRSTIAGAALGIISALMLLAGCASDAHGQATEEFHQTYALAAGGQIHLSNVNGSVTIIAADSNQVKVDAIKRGDAERVKQIRIEVTANPDTIRIETKYPRDGSRFGRNKNAHVDYTLTVPRSARLDKVSLVNGNLAITGTTGDIKASVVNGSLQANDVSGALDLSSVNGKVEATLKAPDKSVRLHSVNGGVVLTAPSDLQAEVKASTVHGGIDNNFGLKLDKGRHVGSSLKGRLGSGTSRIELSTVNGGIDLWHANDGKPLSQAQESASTGEAL